MENKREEQEIVNQIYGFAANMMFEQEKTSEETKQALVEQGLKPEDAEIVVSNLQAQIKQAKDEVANKNMLYGALWCGGGLLVTALTYSAASENGGSYVVAWGAVIFGAWQLLKGLWQKFN